MDLRTYWLAVRSRVCSNCIDGDGWGNCRLDKAIECPVPMFLLRVVDLLNRSGRDSLQEYVTELRAIVCSRCSHQFENGTCSLRQEIDCPLDRYFPHVIEAVEAVNRRLQMQTLEDRGDEMDRE